MRFYTCCAYELAVMTTAATDGHGHARPFAHHARRHDSLERHGGRA
jgi:hypothetical protein